MPPAQRLYLTLLSPQTSPNLLASLEKGCTYGVCSSRSVCVHSSFQSFETKLINVLYTLIKQMGEIMMALSRRIVGQNHINKTRFWTAVRLQDEELSTLSLKVWMNLEKFSSKYIVMGHEVSKNLMIICRTYLNLYRCLCHAQVVVQWWLWWNRRWRVIGIIEVAKGWRTLGPSHTIQGKGWLLVDDVDGKE